MNAVSPEIVVVVEADSVSWLVGSMQASETGEGVCALPGSQAVARYRKERVGTWEDLCVPPVRGTFRECVRKQPGGRVVAMPNHPGVKKQASKEVDIDKLKKQRGEKIGLSRIYPRPFPFKIKHTS